MGRRIVSIGVVAVAGLALAFLLAGCGGSGTAGGTSGGDHGSEPSHDSMGDPYITDAQGRAIKIGTSARAAFRDLGGKSPSGYNGVQAVPPLSYDYPIRGSGTGDAGDVSENYLWWQICVKNGRIVSKVKGRMDSLPTMGC